MQQITQNRLQIVPFTEALAPHFKELNLAWIQKYFAVEPLDERILSAPKEYILDAGGHIFFALYNTYVAGTFAFLKEEDGVFELAKMAVDESFQGKGIGAALLTFAVEKGRELGAHKIILYSNTVLAPAIHLYQKFGFIEVPIVASEYKRSNIKMEKSLA